ncbi:hypothetical protein [Pelagicoccus sp. SDUM812002]|uniref:hypothetical protein n=1 Tax=Pelagicoccus sp. SDUM812002 TaxID=3041266 RepID=UPI00280D6509|nr:hypothetical protein [Pelagicoccus sp. SDUM812002]MDQ8185075.1 hypothetical protein [Pelagicoccus sp. SDUM812002]
MSAFYRFGFYALLLSTAFLAYRFSTTTPPAAESPFTPNEKTDAGENQSSISISGTLKANHASILEPDKATEEMRQNLLAKLSELKSSRDVIIRLPIFDRVSKDLSRSVQSLFDLSPTEVAQLNQQIKATNLALHHEREARSTARLLEDGTLQVDIEPFPERGRQIYEAFTATFKDVIGESNFLTLTQIADSSFEKDFNYFGAEVASLNVKRVTNNPKTGLPVFIASYESDRGESSGSTSSTIVGTDYFTFAGPDIYRLLTAEALLSLPATEAPNP